MTSGDLRHSLSFPKLQPVDRLCFFIVRRVEVSFRSPDMSMTQKVLNRPKILPRIQEGGPKRVSHSVWGNPLPYEGLFTGSLDQTVNRPRGEGDYPVRAVFSQGVEDGMIGFASVLSCLPILLDGRKGLHL